MATSVPVMAALAPVCRDFTPKLLTSLKSRGSVVTSVREQIIARHFSSHRSHFVKFSISSPIGIIKKTYFSLFDRCVDGKYEQRRYLRALSKAICLIAFGILAVGVYCYYTRITYSAMKSLAETGKYFTRTYQYGRYMTSRPAKAFDLLFHKSLWPVVSAFFMTGTFIFLAKLIESFRNIRDASFPLYRLSLFKKVIPIEQGIRNQVDENGNYFDPISYEVIDKHFVSHPRYITFRGYVYSAHTLLKALLRKGFVESEGQRRALIDPVDNKPLSEEEEQEVLTKLSDVYALPKEKLCKILNIGLVQEEVEEVGKNLLDRNGPVKDQIEEFLSTEEARNALQQAKLVVRLHVVAQINISIGRAEAHFKMFMQHHLAKPIWEDLLRRPQKSNGVYVEDIQQRIKTFRRQVGDVTSSFNWPQGLRETPKYPWVDESGTLIMNRYMEKFPPLGWYGALVSLRDNFESSLDELDEGYLSAAEKKGIIDLVKTAISEEIQLEEAEVGRERDKAVEQQTIAVENQIIFPQFFFQSEMFTAFRAQEYQKRMRRFLLYFPSASSRESEVYESIQDLLS